MRKPSLLTGAIFGGLFTLPVTALSFIGLHAAGFPFIPQLTFNTIRDLTPGGLITATIDAIITLINAGNAATAGAVGRLDTAAKTIEELMSLGMFVFVGATAGALYFLIMRRVTEKVKRDLGVTPGAIMGVIFGVIYGLIILTGARFFAADTTTSAIWTFGVMLIFGIAVGFVYSSLAFRVKEQGEVIKPVSGDVQVIDRRTFLVQVGASTATIAVIGAGVGELVRRALTSVENVDVVAAASNAAQSTPDPSAASLPNAGDAVQIVPGTRPEVTPLNQHYRIDIATIPPAVNEEDYTLVVTDRTGGRNELLKEFTLAEVRALPSREDYLTMGCISNRVGGSLISTIKWTGVSMRRFLEEIDVPESATHMRITSADGFDETVALDLMREDERVMLAWAWDDQPLLQRHGFPLRIHIPDRYGMKQPKWILTMEFIEGDEDGYWVRRGWSKDAFVKATSVIDTVAVDMMVTEGEQTLLPIGGIAWAGARGISAVEIRTDGGEWQPAQVRAPISDRTWVLWRYDWAYSEGNHTFEVRCIEADGTVQTDQIAPSRPDGATGLHSVAVTV